nr:hypothetical protein [Tanacetum cinerariifolium]
MAEEDTFLVNNVEGGLCVDYTDVGIVGRCNKIRIRAKWENDDYICRGHILNGMSDSLFDVYTNVESAKELWDSLESKYMAEDSSSKKFLVSNFNNYKMVDSRPVMEQYNELLRILGQYTQHGLKINESISASSIIDKLPPSQKDFKHTLKHGKDDLSLVQLGSHLCIEESLRAQDSDKGKGKEVGGPSVNMTEEGGKNKHHKQNKGKMRSNENNSGSGSNKKPKLECWKCGKTGHFKRDCRSGKKNNANAGGSGKGSKDQSQDQGQNLVPVWNRFVKFSVSLISEAFYVQVDAIAWWIDSCATTHVCKDRCWFKTFKPVEDGSILYMVSGPVLNKCGYKKVYESDKYILSKCGVFVGFGYYNNGHVHYKRMLEMSKDELIPAIDENSKKCTTCNKKYVITFIDDASRFCYVYLLHANDEALDKFRIYKTEVELQQNDLIKTLRIDRGGEYYDPVFFQSVGVIHETTAPYTPQQNGVAKRKNRALKEMVNSMLSYSGLSERAVVRLPDPKRKTLGEKGVGCIFVGYAEHSKAYRFYVIEPNDSVSINSIRESRDAIFNENRFYSIPRPKDIIPNSNESQRDDHSDDVPSEISEPRKDPRTYNEAVQSRDVAFWKEAIDDEIRSIMENNTWVLSDLLPGCKPLGTDYFDTYAPVARITTIRLLLALAAIHNLVIHQMNVKIAFLNGDLDEKVYMKQPERFVMPSNEHKVCKLVKSLYGLKQAPKQWHQKFDEVVLSSGFHLNQSDKCVYSKFNDSGKGVIICLYVDDMLIFGTDQNLVDKTKKFLSSRFLIKDIGEADVILGIKIKRENKGIIITQSHYIEKILKKFNREDCSSMRTPMDPIEKLKLNTGKPVDQLEYSRAIGFLYAMTSTRPDIAYVVGRLSRFTSNPNRQHWKAITRIFKYLRGTKNYGLSYVGYPSMLEDEVKDIYITPRKHQDAATRIALEATRDPYAIITPGKKQEIDLLVDFLECHKYPLDNARDMREFFNFWIQKHKVYVTEEVFINKVTELHERFFHKKCRTFSSDEDIREWS